MKKLTIRTAVNQDLPVLLHLEQQVVAAERPFNSTIKAEGAIYYDLQYLLADEDSHLMVAEMNGEIIATGYVQIRKSKISLKHERHGYLGFMYVAAAHRGLGINKLIMEGLISWTKEQGVFDVYLDVYDDNDAAIKAYEKVGFTKSLVEMKINLNES